MKIIILPILLCCTMLTLAAQQSTKTAPATKPAQKIVTASQVNGTWRKKSGEFKIWALGNQKLKVEFSGVYEYRNSAGLMANVGDAHGTAFIEGDTAVFKPEDILDGCKITMRFTDNKLVVEQEGECEFGRHVTAQGTYRKASKGKPKFEER